MPCFKRRAAGAAFLTALLALMSAVPAGAEEPNEAKAAPRTQAEFEQELNSYLKDQGVASGKLRFAPLFGSKDVVEQTPDGEPVTRQDRERRKYTKYFLSILKEEAEEARKRGVVLPPKRDIWEERKAEVIANRQKYGRETTVNFTIPGTTPEISARIHSGNTRMDVLDGRTVYYTDQETVTIWDSGEVDIKPIETVNVIVDASPESQEPDAASDAPDPNVPKAYLTGVERGFDMTDMIEASEAMRIRDQASSVQRYFEEESKEGLCTSCRPEDVQPQPPVPAVSAEEPNAGSSVQDEQNDGRVEKEQQKADTPVSHFHKRRTLRDRMNGLSGRLFGFFGIESAQAAEAPPFDNAMIEEIRKAGKALQEEGLLKKDELMPEANRTEAEMTANARELVETLTREKKLGGDTALLGEFAPEGGEQFLPEQIEHDSPSERDTYIFISASIGEAEVMKVLEYASGRENVEVVYRGVLETEKTAEGILKIQERAQTFDPPPNIIIDPVLFRAYGVTAVPTVVRTGEKRIRRPKTAIIAEGREAAQMTPEERRLDDELSAVSNEPVSETFEGRTIPQMIAKVEGLNNPRWLNDKIRAGQTGDFGNRGTVYPIEEPDIIEVMQKRVLAINWEEKQKRAEENFWIGQSKWFQKLPTAKQSLSRVIDPTFKVAFDIKDAKGNFIRRKGELVNPLDYRKFDIAVVVWNPTVEEENDVVKRLVKRFEKDTRRVVWTATEFDTRDGWASYKKATELVGGPVFMLTPEIVETWSVGVTPTVVTANNDTKRFIVEEVAPCLLDQMTGECHAEKGADGKH